MEFSFLYQTRTILRQRPRCGLRISARCSRSHSSASPARQALNDTEQVSFFRQKAQEVAARVSQQVPQTLTKQEQAAFDSLRRLAGQRELQARLGITPEPERLDTNPDNILALFTPQPATEVPPTELENDAETTAKTATLQAEAATVEHMIHEICHRQLTSLATTFRSALTSTSEPGDLALWNILETQVFPLLALLKSSQPPLHARPTQRTTKHHTAQTASAAKIAAEKSLATTLLNIPAHIPPLKVLSRYYPAALLLALRLLTKHHPLSLQSHRLLSHLRTLGPSSYILGVTAPFYNTHLLLRWNVYSSLAEICDLLAEMERSAVDFDRGTHRFLADLAEERRADLAALQARDSHGEAGEAKDEVRVREPEWWLMPEQQRWWGVVMEWRAKVGAALEARGMGVVQREGPDEVGLDGRDVPFEGVRPQVWL